MEMRYQLRHTLKLVFLCPVDSFTLSIERWFNPKTTFYFSGVFNRD